jgi:hypothetical protein
LWPHFVLQHGFDNAIKACAKTGWLRSSNTVARWYLAITRIITAVAHKVKRSLLRTIHGGRSAYRTTTQPTKLTNSNITALNASKRADIPIPENR